MSSILLSASGVPGYRCIECGKEAPELYHSYCDGVIKVKHCESCSHVVDKYIEHDTVIVCLDALLHRSQVYRHLLFNVHMLSSWKLTLVYLLCDTYIQWQHMEAQKMQPVQDDYIFYTALEWDVYTIFLIKLIEWLSLVSCVVLLMLLLQRYSLSVSSVRFVHRTLMLSSFAKLLSIPAVIWAQTHSTVYLLLASILVFTSNVAAFRVLPGMSLLSAVLILIISHSTQFAVGSALTHFWYSDEIYYNS